MSGAYLKQKSVADTPTISTRASKTVIMFKRELSGNEAEHNELIEEAV